MLEKRELKYKINNNISYKMENYYLNEIDLQYQVNDNIVIISTTITTIIIIDTGAHPHLPLRCLPRPPLPPKKN